MKPGLTRCWVFEYWDSGGETENSDNGIGGSDGGPCGLWGSDSGITDSDSESNLVMEPWLGRWSWNLDGESRKSTAGTGGGGGVSSGEIGFSY